MESKTKNLKIGETNITGELIATEEKEGQDGRYYISLVLVPAVDTKHYPKQFPIFSRSRLGQIGSDVSVDCELKSRKNGKFHNLSLSQL